MAKKLNLEDLSTDEKKKLGKVSFISIFSVILLCVIIVSCFACSNDGNHLTAAQQAEADKAYWKSAVANTTWTASTTDKNDGILDGQTVKLDLEISYEKATDKLSVYFKSGNVEMLNGTLTLDSSKGKIAIAEGDTWDIKLSEKNDVMYLTISCGNKDVHYTCSE